MIGIYKITNTVNNKCYIGQAVDVGRRFREHKNKLNKGLHKNTHLQRSWDKYGAAAFKFSVEEVLEDLSLLNDKEIYYIQLYNSVKNGYNMTEGGGGHLGLKGEEHHSYSHKTYTFYHKNGIVEKDITFYNMRTKYNLGAGTLSNVLSGVCPSYKGWRITEESKEVPSNKFCFINKDNTKELNISVPALCKKYDLTRTGIYRISQNKLKISQGWKLLKTIN